MNRFWVPGQDWGIRRVAYVGGGLQSCTPGLNDIPTDMLDMPDYGENAKYSLLEQNVAIAEWVRAEAGATAQDG